jgi:hypothetical protein
VDAIVNLGNPLKKMTDVLRKLLPAASHRALKITGARIWSSRRLLMTSPLYGAAMVRDCLAELWNGGAIQTRDRVILVGSMGSLSDAIATNDVVLPNPALCAYYGFGNRELRQSPSVMSRLRQQLRASGYPVKVYRHGSSYAVFDQHTDHTTYKNRLYGNRVSGVDCGEVFVGMEFLKAQRVLVGAILYCSDSPGDHILNVGHRTFAKRAANYDLLLNEVAAQALSGRG